LDNIKLAVRSIEEDIVAIKEEILAVRKKRNECRRRSPMSQKIGVSEDINVSRFDLNSVFLRLMIDIREDVKLICRDIWQAIIILKPPIILQYFLIILISVALILKSTYSMDIIFYTLVAFYISWKVFNIVRRNQKIDTSASAGRGTSQQTNFQQEKTFESYLYELEQRNDVQGQYLMQKRLREKELAAQIQLMGDDLTSLKQRQAKLIDRRQSKGSEIENWRFRLEELLYLDRLTWKWLEEDVEKLISKVKRKVDLIEREYIGESGSLILDPIRVVNGCTSRSLSPKLLVEDENEKDSRRNKILDRYSDDAKSAYDYSGKEKRYGIYEVQAIFICPTFLSSYKCYYNFIRDQSIDEEYCEYLYNSIVFTKIQEQSSINMQGSSKYVNSKCLTISTNDGKLLSLQIGRSRGERRLSSNPSKIDTAATEIRTKLR
jgi:hypothetical protein